MDELGFWLFLALIIVLFAGEPDLHDRLVGNCHMPPPATKEE